MYIHQAQQIDSILKQNNEPGKASPTDVKNQTEGVFPYAKMKESYRMTENGSFFMPEATYDKPGVQEETTVVEQLDEQMTMSAENRKNQMVVVSNTASPQDLEEMSRDGFSAMDMDSRSILTVTDKIKAVLAKAGVDISIYGDDLSVEQLEQATGNTAIAHRIAGALKDADLPVNKANLKECKAAYVAAEAMVPLQDAAKEYLLKQGWEPTIKNLYTASYSGVASVPQEGIDYAPLENSMKQVILHSGEEVSPKSMEQCKWLIERNIPLTVSNFKYLVKLEDLSRQLEVQTDKGVDADVCLQSIVEAIKEGKRPMDALLIQGFSAEDIAKEAFQVINNAKEEDLAYCIQQQWTVNVENLQISMNISAKEIGEGIDTDLRFVTAKRRLEETRLVMTIEANHSLVKRGIAIDTKPLEQLIEDLKNVENQYYKELLSYSEIDSDEKNVEILSATTRIVHELRYQPAYVLEPGTGKDTLVQLHQAGSQLKNTMETALSAYETLWTAPRKDMGDSIQKAFANVDEILKDMNLEVSEMNRRAVRILAYNETELNPENITRIKDVDLKMQNLFRNLTPAVTMELIRREQNPLDMEINTLNSVVEEVSGSLGDYEEERFSKYLWKLEQNKEISREERDSYIGIYRLIAQVEKTDGAAIGALLNQGGEITMRNILTAMRSMKKSMDYTVDDHFEGVESSYKGPRIDHQIMASFQTNCVKEVMDVLSPEKLQTLPHWEELTPEQLLSEMQQWNPQTPSAEAEYYSEMAREYQGILEASDDVYGFLEKYDLKNSANNVLAVSRLLENPSNVFEVLFSENGKSNDYREKIRQLKEQVLRNFGEAVKTPEAMAQAQEILAEVAERTMQGMIIENETISVKDLKDLRMMNQQLFLCKEKAKEESFLVPVQTGDSVTGISLKIVRGKGNKGLVDIFFRGALMEKVAASFEAKENKISGVIATTDEETRRLFADNLGIFTENMHGDGSAEAMDITVAKVDDLSLWQFEKNTLSEQGEASPVQTKRLYHIAESFIQTVSELMN